MISAVISNLTKMVKPAVGNLGASGFNNPDDVLKGLFRNLALIVCDDSFSSARNPNLCPVDHGLTFCHVNMDGFQRSALVRQEVNPVRANFKNLRHCQILPPAKIP
jgi:hypothetical protein